jgi:hypothetical protein
MKALTADDEPEGSHPGGASPNEIAHRFMAFIGHPYWSELAGTQ